MQDHWNAKINPADMRVALQKWEIDEAGAVPDYRVIHSSIQNARPPESRRGAKAWTALLGALVAAQFRIVPGTMALAAVGIAVIALIAGKFQSSGMSVGTNVMWFSAILLFGVVVSVALWNHQPGPDEIALVTPVSPQSVALIRLLTVIACDLAIGIIASVVLALWGGEVSLAAYLLSWAIPLLPVAGISALLSLWFPAAVGVAVGALCIPTLVPTTASVLGVNGGPFMWSSASAIWPAAVALVGVASFGVAIATSGKAIAIRSAT